MTLEFTLSLGAALFSLLLSPVNILVFPKFPVSLVNCANWLSYSWVFTHCTIIENLTMTSAHPLGPGPRPCAICPRTAVVVSSLRLTPLLTTRKRNQDSRAGRQVGERRTCPDCEKHQANSKWRRKSFYSI